MSSSRRGSPASETRASVVVAVVVVLIVVGLGGIYFVDPGVLGIQPAASPSNASNGTVGSNASVIDYTSSVDGHPLSYSMWYPPHYTASGTYTFLLFLHGVESTNVCSNVPTYAGGASMINAANAAGWLVGSLCTRVTDGWYVNSPSTGPEETDVLDAIAHEKNLTHVAAVYLVGMSMGSDGALSIATDHPSLFAGVGAVATCADFFEEAAYYLHAHAVLPPGFAQVAGTAPTVLPAPGSIGAGLEYHLSAFRFYPQNLSAVRIYVVAGGADQTCIDNTEYWPWMQANNTVLASSCVVASAEPTDCSTPIASLAGSHPGQFECRFVYEPLAPHTFDQLNGTDLVSFFQGNVAPGTYAASLGDTPSPDPSAVQA
ncbi:MAG: hypothetical protein L3K17_02380 [Thermoplasmata archaeon]|nr:hypothetical protein [Thermoplasmata archaeon]